MLMSVHSIQYVYLKYPDHLFCEDGLSIMVTLQYMYALQGLSHPPGFPVPWMFGPYDFHELWTVLLLGVGGAPACQA